MRFILVWEQDRRSVERLRYIVGAAGWQVETADDRKTFDELIVERSPELLFVGSQEPDAAAVIAAHARKNGGNGAIALVPENDPEAAETFARLADEILRTPVSYDDVRDLVKYWEWPPPAAAEGESVETERGDETQAGPILETASEPSEFEDRSVDSEEEPSFEAVAAVEESALVGEPVAELVTAEMSAIAEPVAAPSSADESASFEEQTSDDEPVRDGLLPDRSLEETDSDIGTPDESPTDLDLLADDLAPVGNVAKLLEAPGSVIGDRAIEETAVEETALEEPLVEASSMEDPAIEEPVFEDAAIEDLALDEPVIDSVSIDDAAATNLGDDDPIAPDPILDAPTVEEPVVQELAADEPVSDEPVSEDPVSEDAVGGEFASEESIVDPSVAPIVERPLALLPEAFEVDAVPSDSLEGADDEAPTEDSATEASSVEAPGPVEEPAADLATESVAESQEPLAADGAPEDPYPGDPYPGELYPADPPEEQALEPESSETVAPDSLGKPLLGEVANLEEDSVDPPAAELQVPELSVEPLETGLPEDGLADERGLADTVEIDTAEIFGSADFELPSAEPLDQDGSAERVDASASYLEVAELEFESENLESEDFESHELDPQDLEPREFDPQQLEPQSLESGILDPELLDSELLETEGPAETVSSERLPDRMEPSAEIETEAFDLSATVVEEAERSSVDDVEEPAEASLPSDDVDFETDIDLDAVETIAEPSAVSSGAVSSSAVSSLELFADIVDDLEQEFEPSGQDERQEEPVDEEPVREELAVEEPAVEEPAVEDTIQLAPVDETSTADAELATPQPAFEFGIYRLDRLLSVGELTERWRARRRGSDEASEGVMVERLLPEVADSGQQVQAIVETVKRAVSLTHNNIAQVYDFGTVEGRFYVASELIAGPRLVSVLRRPGKAERGKAERGQPERALPQRIGALVGLRVAQALDYAHRRQDFAGNLLSTVHGGVSVDRIRLSENGEVKLGGFGLVPPKEGNPPAELLDDVRALGAVLCECVTGYVPVFAPETAAVEGGWRSDARPLLPDLSDRLAELIEAMILAPFGGLDSMAEVVERLEVAVTELGPFPGPADLRRFVEELPELDAETELAPAAVWEIERSPSELAEGGESESLPFETEAVLPSAAAVETSPSSLAELTEEDAAPTRSEDRGFDGTGAVEPPTDLSDGAAADGLADGLDGGPVDGPIGGPAGGEVLSFEEFLAQPSAVDAAATDLVGDLPSGLPRSVPIYEEALAEPPFRGHLGYAVVTLVAVLILAILAVFFVGRDRRPRYLPDAKGSQSEVSSSSFRPSQRTLEERPPGRSGGERSSGGDLSITVKAQYPGGRGFET